MHAIVLGVAYDGAPYSGFAIQDNARTVGGELMRAIHQFDGAVSTLRVASRTDAGVHARDQRCAFNTTADIPMRAWVRGMQQHLPRSIVVLHAARAEEGYNPRYLTLSKRYRYLLLCQHRGDPFLEHRAWRVGPVDDEQIGIMESELAAIVGTHDFAGFASAKDQREHTERTMTTVSVNRIDNPSPVVAIDIVGTGFLHNMVRIIVGTAVDCARTRLEPGATARALSSKQRTDLGMTAPAAGLYLESLALEKEGTDRWPPL